MKKGFWTIPLMAIAVACAVFLSACGGPSVEELIREDINEAFAEVSPENEEMVEAISSSSDGAFDQLGVDPQVFAEVYFDGFGHEIKSVEVDERAGTATAVVTVKIKSLSAVMAEFMTQFQAYVDGLDPATVGSEEELYHKAGEILMDVASSAEVAETECTFEYEKDGENSWSASEGTENEILEAMM